MLWFHRKIKTPLRLGGALPAEQKPMPDPSGQGIPEWFKSKLASCTDARFESIRTALGQVCTLIYIDEIIDHAFLQQFVVPAIVTSGERFSGRDWLQQVKRELTASAQPETDPAKALDAVMNGSVLLVFEQESELLLVPIRSVEKRQTTESKNEPVIRGPKESFIEEMQANLGLVRKRIKHPDLKTEELHFGTYTKTAVTVTYIEGLCKPELLEELRRRLSQIEIDSVLGSSYLEEYIEDNPFSPFPQVQYTERPDTMAAALLEGRIGILVDGTPMALIVPVTLYMLLQSSEDYYQRYIAATWIRWIRYLFLLIAFFLPSTYIAITTFNPEMLPPNLLVTVAAARESVPFPAIVEAMLMEISFEAIREAGLRIPKPLGQTVSIIGALIVGQASVQAGIVSAPMLIVVSITGIASFLIPHFDLALAIRLLRFPVMLLAASFGLYGILICILLIYLHLVTLRSFGTPYMSPTAPIHFSDWKDVLYRAPWWMMKRRPTLYGNDNRERIKPTRRAEMSEKSEW